MAFTRFSAPASFEYVAVLPNTHLVEIDVDLYGRAEAVAEKRGDDLDEIVIRAIERFIASKTRMSNEQASSNS